jgi:hypothetical protein
MRRATPGDDDEQAEARVEMVTRDIPAGVFAAANPCRIVREIGA